MASAQGASPRPVYLPGLLVLQRENPRVARAEIGWQFDHALLHPRMARRFAPHHAVAMAAIDIGTMCFLLLSSYFMTRFTEGFSGFVTSTAAPIAFGGSTSSGGACTRWNSIAASRRTPIMDNQAISTNVRCRESSNLFALRSLSTPNTSCNHSLG